MARKNNVNPDRYKTAGREPQGQSVFQDVERQKLGEEKARLSRSATSPVPAPQRKENSAVSKAPEDLGADLQATGPRGKVSTAQKMAGSRHGLNSTPATRPVAGAHGKQDEAAGIVARRVEYDGHKQSTPAKKKCAASKAKGARQV